MEAKTSSPRARSPQPAHGRERRAFHAPLPKVVQILIEFWTFSLGNGVPGERGQGRIGRTHAWAAVFWRARREGSL